jgi:hypothetical protein
MKQSGETGYRCGAKPPKTNRGDLEMGSEKEEAPLRNSSCFLLFGKTGFTEGR